MKKLLLSFSALLMIGSASAQVDTLYEHFTGATTYYTTQGGGYVFGPNEYGDLAKGMRFNAANGLTSGGQLTGFLLNVGAKVGTGAMTVKVYNFGSVTALGSEIATLSVPMASIDTAAADGMMVGGRDYNNYIQFTTPVTIPAAQDIVIMIFQPTDGTSAAVFSSNSNTDFANASTHTFEIWSDNALHDVGTAWAAADGTPFNAAMSLFPVVDFVAGINENVISSAVYPNPAKEMLNITASEEIAFVTITTMDGKSVLSTEGSAINVSELSNGMYIYTATTVSGKVARGSFAKN